MHSKKMKTYPFSAGEFVQWATHPSVEYRVKGLIEHHSHHLAVTKYQIHTVIKPSNDDSWLDGENMPNVIRLAQLVMSENPIAANHKDFRLHGRLDQLYFYLGEYFIVDTKSHQEPTFSDQLQLSFYSLILELLGYKMAKVAFVRSVYAENVVYEAVDTIPFAAMEEIIGEVE